MTSVLIHACESCDFVALCSYIQKEMNHKSLLNFVFFINFNPINLCCNIIAMACKKSTCVDAILLQALPE